MNLQLWNTFHDPQDIEPVLDDSLNKLGTDYIDLYLIHWLAAVTTNDNWLALFDASYISGPSRSRKMENHMTRT